MATTTHNPDGTTSTTIDLVSDRGKLDAIADVLEGCRRYAETAHRAVSQRFHSGGYMLYGSWDGVSDPD